ncbi:MAG: hypothetical protein K2M56_00015 [Muribaculaceae bacterium]|nr:hypothetical protein [Muribaculaceae bacterium]
MIGSFTRRGILSISEAVTIEPRAKRSASASFAFLYASACCPSNLSEPSAPLREILFRENMLNDISVGYAGLLLIGEEW